jgi:hypothetical protein
VATLNGSRVRLAASNGRAAKTMPSPMFDEVAAVQTVQKRRPSGRNCVERCGVIPRIVAAYLHGCWRKAALVTSG